MEKKAEAGRSKGRIGLEICVDSVESAIAAERGGADRLELCADLALGGTTPPMGLYESVRRHVQLPVRVLLRPRAGDFCYTDLEYEVLLSGVRAFREAGADALVVGILTPEGDVDLPRMREVCALAFGMDLTVHRAFDMVRDPERALEEIATLPGVSTVLTSGQAPDVVRGLENLKRLCALAQGKLQILPGGGVRPDNLGLLARELPQVRCFHFSAKRAFPSRMRWRNPAVQMGSGQSGDDPEYTIWRADEGEVRRAREILDEVEQRRTAV